MLVQDTFLEKKPWKVVNDLSVNPVPMDSYFPELINDELEIFSVASKPYGGALAHCPRPVPTFNGSFITPYMRLDTLIKIPATAAQLLRCLELDAKTALFPAPAGQTAQNLVDFSTQIKLFDGGKIQIDDQNMHWIDTGLAVGTLPIDTWFPWSAKFFIDSANKKYSVLSFDIAGAHYDVPSSLQNLTWQSSNWGMASEPSLQCDDNTAPGAFVVDYKLIHQYWSDTGAFI